MTLLPPFLPQSIRYGQNAYPDVEPFSLRAAASYEDIQYSIVTWIRDQLSPWIADNGADAVWASNVEQLIATVNTALAGQTTDFQNLLHDMYTAPAPSGDTTGATDQAAL